MCQGISNKYGIAVDYVRDTYLQSKKEARKSSGDVGALQPRFEIFGDRLGLSRQDKSWARAEYETVRLANVRVLPHAKELVESFRSASETLLILTNGDGELQRARLEACWLRWTFAKLFASTDVSAKKPSEQAFLETLHIMGATPEDTRMVGDDAVSDLMPAAGLGIETWRVRGNAGGTFVEKWPA